MKRAIREKEPLSPFLFVLAAELLNKMLQLAVQQNYCRGPHIARYELLISHPQFADDTLIFCETNTESLWNVNRTMLCFPAISGLAVNYHKSGLVMIGVDQAEACEMALPIGFKLVNLPITYLGIPLGGNVKKISYWTRMLQRIKNRLSTWKANAKNKYIVQSWQANIDKICFKQSANILALHFEDSKCIGFRDHSIVEKFLLQQR